VKLTPEQLRAAWQHATQFFRDLAASKAYPVDADGRAGAARAEQDRSEPHER
jgi:hypothetical protein